MSDAPRYATLRDYLRVVRANSILIVLCTLMFAGAGLFLSQREDKVYVSSASVGFSDERANLDLLGQPVAPRQTPQERAAVHAETLLSPSVTKRAATKLGPELAAGLDEALSVRTAERTNLVVVEARWDDAETAAKIANRIAVEGVKARIRSARRSFDRLADDVRREQRLRRAKRRDEFTRQANRERLIRLRTLAETSRPARVVRFATPSLDPISPRPVRTALLAGLVGLTLGLVAAFVRDALDRRLRGAGEIREQLDLPLLGHVRKATLGRTWATGNGRKALGDHDFEPFRILRTNLDFLDVDRPPRTVLVTSALPEEGKSTVAASLACAYALAGRRVLLLECDLRRPTLGKRLGLDGGPGLTDVLSGEVHASDAIRRVRLPETAAASRNGHRNGDGPPSEAEPGLACLTAGSPTQRPAELLGSERFGELLAALSRQHDVVIVDSSPLLSVGDTLELVPRADSIVICVRARQTTRDQARAAGEALHRFPPRPTGVVVTGVRPGDELDYGYYSYAYAYGTKK